LVVSFLIYQKVLVTLRASRSEILKISLFLIFWRGRTLSYCYFSFGGPCLVVYCYDNFTLQDKFSA